MHDAVVMLACSYLPGEEVLKDMDFTADNQQLTALVVWLYGTLKRCTFTSSSALE
jgi:predicted DNA-binding protein with PD1-like motif